MKRFIMITTALLISACSGADAGELFEDYLWQKRLVLVFAPRSDDPRLFEQRAILERDQDGLKQRDIVSWEFVYLDSVAVDGEQKVHLSTNPFYNEYDVGIRDFAFILIGKDGEIKMRKDKPISTDSLYETIDAMPMRQREIQERR